MFSSIRHKIQAVSVAFVVLTVLSLSILSIRSLRKALNDTTPTSEQRVERRFNAELRRHVEIMQTVLDASLLGNRDRLSPAEADAVALSLAREARFGGRVGYFFVYDFQGKALVNGAQPENEGKNLWERRDGRGVAVIQRLQDVALAGGGFVSYEWPKPGAPGEVSKLAYATRLRQRDWWIGTGVYLDDMRRELEPEEREAHASERDHLRRVALVSIALCVAALIAGGIVGGRISRPLGEMVMTARRLANGDRSIRLPEAGRDEVSDLARALNSMAGDIEATTERLEEEKRHRSGLLESLADGVVITDADNCIVEVNPAAEQIFGYEPGELVGRPTHVLIPEELRSDYEQGTMQSVLRGAVKIHERVPRRRKDGSTIEVRITVAPVVGGDGQVRARIHSIVPLGAVEPA